MLEISLTTFVDFVSKVGTPRITYVKKAKKLYSEGYHPAIDFWRPLRNAIIEMHKQNEPINYIDRVLSELHDTKKLNLYPELIDQYKKWLGRKEVFWTGCDSRNWKYEDFIVKINPELGLNIDGYEYIIKLYFKAEKLSKNRIETILYLIKSTLPREKKDAIPGIIDVKNGKLLKATKEKPEIKSLLEGEAVAFKTMWNSV